MISPLARRQRRLALSVAGARGLLRPYGSVQGRRCGDLPPPTGGGAEEWPCFLAGAAVGKGEVGGARWGR